MLVSENPSKPKNATREKTHAMYMYKLTALQLNYYVLVLYRRHLHAPKLIINFHKSTHNNNNNLTHVSSTDNEKKRHPKKKVLVIYGPLFVPERVHYVWLN